MLKKLASRKILLIMLILSAGVMATGFFQTPNQTPTQSPCASAELKASMAETQAAAQALRAEVCELKQAEAEVRSRQYKEVLDVVSVKLEETKTSVAKLASEKEAQTASITSLTTERDKLALKIKKANGRWICEVLHLGCVGER